MVHSSGTALRPVDMRKKRWASSSISSLITVLMMDWYSYRRRREEECKV